MANTSQPTEIQPYLQSAYWDGHYTGDQDITKMERLVLGIEGRHVYRLAESELDDLGNAFPLATLDQGRTFDPTDHAIGTLAFLSEELLDLENRYESLVNTSVHPLPERPVEISFTSRTIEGANIKYRSYTRLGVVACPKATGQKELYTLPITRLRNGWAIPGPNVRFKETPLTVGSTRHDLIAPRHERLTRVNRIQIVSQGGTKEPVPKRYWGFGLLRKLVTG